MVEKSLRVIRMAANGFAGASQSFAVPFQGAVEVTARIRNLAHQRQRLGPLSERLVRKLGFVLPFVIPKRPCADRVERIESADGIQLFLEITEHEADEPLRF